MNRYTGGLVAGFAATVALSVLMLIKAALGMLPGLNVIHLLAALSHHIVGTPATPVAGWIVHFLIGSVLWGLLFAWLVPRLPGNNILRGLVFATGAWLLMMIILMPLAGKGLFGAGVGIALPIATLILHWAYGAVLGYVFGELVATDAGARGK